MKKLLTILLICQFLNISLSISKDKNQGWCMENVVKFNEDGVMNMTRMLTCCKGYVYMEHASRCEPYCKNNCPNGRCIAPNTCKCDYDYEPVKDEANNSECKWTGYESCRCINGECLPNSSNMNHLQTMESVRKITCCKGYVYIDIAKRCEPICENGCYNGRCIAPNKCKCDEYYEPVNADDSSLCELTGQEICNCSNGQCLHNGDCICNKGFIRALSLKGEIKCESLKEFVGTILAMILAIPLVFGSIILLVICWKKKKTAAAQCNKFERQQSQRHRHQHHSQQQQQRQHSQFEYPQEHHNRQFAYDNEEEAINRYLLKKYMSQVKK